MLTPTHAHPLHPPPTPHTHAPPPTVYHVTEKGWTKVKGEDVGELYYRYFPEPGTQCCASVDVIKAVTST